MIDDEKLLAYLDGELDAPSAKAVERAIADDPAIAARYDQHRRLRDVLRERFGALLKEPVPSRLSAAMTERPTVIDFDTARSTRAARRRVTVSNDWRRWSALAATLVAGFVGGYMLKPGASGPVREQGGQILVSTEIGRALDTQLASAPQTGAAVRVALSFRDKDGKLCRSFQGASATGVACKAQDGWRMAGLFPGEGAQGSYRMASGGDPRLMMLVDGMIEGAPLNERQERAAQARGWRSR